MDLAQSFRLQKVIVTAQSSNINYIGIKKLIFEFCRQTGKELDFVS